MRLVFIKFHLILKQDILSPIAEILDLKNLKPNMENWDSLVKRVIAPSNEVKIAFVGKYVDLKESYKSLTEAIIHAGAALDTKVELKWVDSEKLENMESSEVFKDVSGIFGCWGIWISWCRR